MSPSGDDVEILKEIKREKEVIKNVRLKLAKRNTVISVLHRKLDEVPTRPELAQYQRRFLELYNQGCYFSNFYEVQGVVGKLCPQLF